MTAVERAGPDEDWPALLAMLRRAFAFMAGRIDPPSSLDRLDAAGLRRRAMDEICLVARDGDAMTRCVFCQRRAGTLYIGKFAVEPDRQGRGIGRPLIDATEAEARRHGLTALELQTRIELAENHRAFAAMGFVKTGETAHRGFDRSTSITMRKTL